MKERGLVGEKEWSTELNYHDTNDLDKATFQLSDTCQRNPVRPRQMVHPISWRLVASFCLVAVLVVPSGLASAVSGWHASASMYQPVSQVAGVAGGLRSTVASGPLSHPTPTSRVVFPTRGTILGKVSSFAENGSSSVNLTAINTPATGGKVELTK